MWSGALEGFASREGRWSVWNIGPRSYRGTGISLVVFIPALAHHPQPVQHHPTWDVQPSQPSSIFWTRQQEGLGKKDVNEKRIKEQNMNNRPIIIYLCYMWLKGGILAGLWWTKMRTEDKYLWSVLGKSTGDKYRPAGDKVGGCIPSYDRHTATTMPTIGYRRNFLVCNSISLIT